MPVVEFFVLIPTVTIATGTSQLNEPNASLDKTSGKQALQPESLGVFKLSI
jgi:hypothetical protein